MCSETCYLSTQKSWAEGPWVRGHPELQSETVSSWLKSFKIEKSWWGPEQEEILRPVIKAWPEGVGGKLENCSSFLLLCCKWPWTPQTTTSLSSQLLEGEKSWQRESEASQEAKVKVGVSMHPLQVLHRLQRSVVPGRIQFPCN